MLVTWNFLKQYNREVPLPEDVRTLETINTYKNEFKIKSNEDKLQLLYKFYLKDDLNLHKNKYPYNLDNGIEHYVLWIHPNYENKCSTKDIKIFIENFLKDNQFSDYIYFENNNLSKSILNIKHYQVFFKKI
jgi:hypothetical protein